MKHFNWIRLWAGVGAVHFAVAIAFWCLHIAILLRSPVDRWVWRDVAIRVGPCVVLLVGFIAAAVLAKRRRPLAKLLAAAATFVTVCWFGFDAYRRDYQFQALTRHGCEHTYITWWWYDDHWNPNR